MTNQLIPLHTHSVYSLLDALIKIEDYVAWGKENDMPALALTDHGSLAGSIKMFKECNKQGIKPILGFEAYMTLDLGEQVRDNYHIILLAKNKTGWLNLIKLHNLSYYNFYYKPRITFEDLEKCSEGIIACSACLAGIIPKMILAQNMQKIDEYIKKFKSIFGEDFYLELQDHGIPQQKAVNLVLVQLAKKYNIKLVATNDSHYTNKEDSFAHEVLLCKQTHKKISDTNRMSFGTDEFYLKNTKEMKKAISYLGDNVFTQVLESSQEIYDKVEEYDILQHQYNYPTFGDKKESLNKLVSLAQNGFKKRFAGKPINTKVYIERLKYELETIYKIGFTDYFLVLYDLYKFMDNANIATGFGRGCLVFDTPVVTNNGIKKLGEVKIGDKVITHDGTWKTVTQTHEYDCDEKLLAIDTWCSSPFLPTMTSDHKVLVVKQPFAQFMTKYKKNNYIKNATQINKTDYLNKNNLKWVRADEVEQGDYLVRPIYRDRYNNKFIDKIDLAKFAKDNDTIGEDFIEEYCGGNQNTPARIQRLPRYINIDKDFLYLLGFYIGDGWTHKGAVVFACHEEKDLKVIDFIYKYFKNIKLCNYKGNGKKVCQIYAYSRVFAKLFEEIIPKYAQNKIIPEFALSQDLDKVQGLFEGLIQSDGSCSEDRICYDSINLNLINQLRYIGDLLGYTSNITVRKGCVDNRGYKRSESYKIRFNKQTLQFNSFNDGEYVYMKVKSINEYENQSKKVYDITVNENHNYQTLDCIVHNSGAGSLVLYCLNVTQLDPIKHKLLFERFINPERISAPDVDCDVEDVNRGKVINYIEQTYTKERVCNIATYGSLTSVASFKAVASVMEMPFVEANRISKDLLNTELSLDENMAQSEELQKMYKTDSLFAQIFDVAKRLEGGIDKRGVHAAGVVISNQPLENLTPVMYIEDASGKKINCSAFEMTEIDGDLKLLKLDILGLKNLSIVKDAMNRLSDKAFNFKDIKFDDEKTFKMITDGLTLGVFQLESDIMKHLCREIKPKTLADLSVINAGARPGALESGLTQSFIDRRNGKEKIDYVVDGMEKYLKDTLGLFLYQENLMQLSQVMAGYTMPEADGLRKIVGKKLIDKLPKERKHFIEGCLNKGHSEKKANEVFDMIEKFGRYGFNASHSFAYSALSYVTAYLKANYPLQYMTSLLNANSDNLDKLNPYIDECYRLGIDVLPPNINKSMYSFEHDEDDNAILFGFNGIKGVGVSTVEPIIAERNNGNFISLEDLLNRIPSINKSAVENLIKCGAFNAIESNPYKYLPVLEFSSKAKAKAEYKKGNISYYDCLIRCYVESVMRNNPSYQLVEQQIKNIKGTKKEDKEQKQKLKNDLEAMMQFAIKTFRKSEGKKPSVPVLKENEMEILGFPISNNPKKEIIALQEFIDNDKLSEIKASKDYTSMYYFIGRIKSIKRTRNGSYFAVLTDDIDEITTFMKRETYVALEDKLIQPSNYFRICGTLNKSYNPDKYEDNFKLEGIRYFNTSRDSEIVVKCDTTPQVLKTVLTKIKEMSIINIEDINYRLNILCNNKKFTTKIDYWIQDINSISSLMIEYNMTVVK